MKVVISGAFAITREQLDWSDSQIRNFVGPQIRKSAPLAAVEIAVMGDELMF
jgi:hypothetical protein